MTKTGMGAARAVRTIAGRLWRAATTHTGAVLTVAAAGAAAVASAIGAGGAARASVTFVGGAALGLPSAMGRVTRRWPVGLAALAAVAVAIGAARSGELTGLEALACALAALALAGTLGVRWWTWSGVWALAGALGVTALLVGREAGVAIHRLAVLVLAAALLVAVARGMSKLALRLTAAILLVTAVCALAWIGDRATTPTDSPRVRAEVRATLVAIGDEATALRDELPCGRKSERARDAQLCAALADLDQAAAAASRRDDAGASAVTPLFADLDRLRVDVAVRLMPSSDEPAARVAAAEQAEDASGPTSTPAGAGAATDPRDLRELTAAGVDEVVDDTLGPLVGAGTIARLGTAGWVVLGLLLALGYRRLEVINNRRYGGPVLVADVTGGPGTGSRSPELTAAIRNRVAELDLRDPSPVPGADASAKPTADIVGSLGADPAPPSGRLGAALTAVRHAVVPAPGMTVVPAYTQVTRPGPAPEAGATRSPADGHGGGRPHATTPGVALASDAGAGAGDRPPGGEVVEHTIAVRLVTPDRRRTLGAASFTRPTEASAARAAADYAVCDALNRGALTPSWARWSAEDGSALGPYQAVVADSKREGAHLPVRRQIALLEAARAASPVTGIVLVELGHRYELDERPLDALRMHLTARALHPRFAPARYRTAASLSMLAAPGRLEEHWLAPDRADDRRQIADLLVDSGLVARARRSRWWKLVGPRCPDDTDELRRWLAQADPSPGTHRELLKVFLLVARAELLALDRRFSCPGVLAGTARQAERHVWLQLLASPARRRHARQRYRTARWIAELRLTLIPSQPGTKRARALQQKVEALAERPDVGSTALYNAACFTSVVAERSPAKGEEQVALQERAVRYLSLVALWAHGPTPSSGWLTTDPDLVSLQAVPAFNDLARRLADDEEHQTTPTL
jgi:hypothetical protein